MKLTFESPPCNKIIIPPAETCWGHISKIPRLSADEEMYYFQQLNSAGPEKEYARCNLIVANLRLVMFVANKYKDCGMCFDDLFQEGCFGLINAVDTFDITKGYPFGTYASIEINHSIYAAVITKNRQIYIPYPKAQSINKIKKLKKRFLEQNGRNATLSELASLSGLSANEILTLLKIPQTTSLDGLMQNYEDFSENPIMLDAQSELPFEQVEAATIDSALEVVLSALPIKEERVLRLFYGVLGQEPILIKDIAKLPEFGVSAERTRQIKERALERIRTTPDYCNMLIDYIE